MNKRIEKEKLYYYLIIFCFAVIYVPSPIATYYSNFDGSFHWALNYFFYKNPYNFSTIFHSSGPYSLLKWPAPMGHHLLFASLFNFTCKFIFAYYLLKAYLKNENPNYFQFAFILLLFFSLVSLDGIILALLIFSFANLLFQRISWAETLPAIFIFSIATFIKSSIHLPALFLFLAFLGILILEKKYKWALYILGFYFFFMMLHSIFIYHKPFYFLSYIYRDIEMAFIYSAGSALSYPNHILYLILQGGIMLLPLFILKLKKEKLLYLLVLLLSFLFWKYTLGRQDKEHMFFWLQFLFFLFVLMLLFTTKAYRYKVLLCIAASFFFFSINVNRGFYEAAIPFQLPNAHTLARAIFKEKNWKEEWKKHNETLFSYYVPDSLLNKIGNKNVDVFPWQIGIFSKYTNLHYQARPYLQSSLFSIKGDQSDSIFYTKTNAPEKLLWHISEPRKYFLNAHDNKYIPNEASLAFAAILKNYKLEIASDTFCLWTKQFKTASETKNYSTQQIQLQKKIAIPCKDSNNTFIMAKIQLQEGFVTKLKGLFYKPAFYKIVYYLSNDKKVMHSISATSLQYGFLIQPYFTNPKLDYEEVKEIEILADYTSNQKLIMQIESIKLKSNFD